MRTAWLAGAVALASAGCVGPGGLTFEHRAQAGRDTGHVSSARALRLRTAQIALGAELFAHVWTPDDALAGGDGLGPAFNDVSCVACHGAPAMGAAGPNDKNVRLLAGAGLARVAFRGVVGTDGGLVRDELEREAREEIAAAIAARRFGSSRPVEEVERNTPSLFGAGLIDRIPDDAIHGMAAHQATATPKSQGRAGSDAEGRVTRFGWKADVADLQTFVAQACANELGLSTPHSEQRGRDGRVDVLAAVDLSQEQLDALVAFTASLPRPVDMLGDLGPHPGEALFTDIGCADCHVRQLGDVDGLYSDLLLHDMGRTLGEGASTGYYGVAPAVGVGRPASVQEWRTPPLWGIADSAPYLHDGRAATIEEAIFLHDGQGARAADRYRGLAPGARRALVGFLRALQLPDGELPDLD